MPLSHKCRPPCLNIWARCAETWNSSTGNLCRAEDTKKLFLPVALQGNKRAFPLRLGVSCDPSYPSSFSPESIARVFPCIPAGSSVTLPRGRAAGTNSKCHPGAPTITLQVRLCPQRCWGSTLVREYCLKQPWDSFPEINFQKRTHLFQIWQQFIWHLNIIEQTFVRDRTRSLCCSLTILLPWVWPLWHPWEVSWVW